MRCAEGLRCNGRLHFLPPEGCVPARSEEPTPRMPSLQVGSSELIAQAILRKSEDTEGVRPFDIGRDLNSLANLIEVAFASELDRTGNTIARDMRRLASSGPLLWMLDALGAFSPSPMHGFVWIARGKLAGNVTLTLENERTKVWSISNVAVHPDLQGHGIALQLMRAALEQVRAKGARWLVLEVRTDNAPAQRLYQELGFRAYDQVDELGLASHRWPTLPAAPLSHLRERRPGDSEGLYRLARSSIPASAQEVYPLQPQQYRLDLGQRLQSWLAPLVAGRQKTDWVLEESGEIIAWLQVTGQYTLAAHRLQIVVHPSHRGMVESQIVAVGLEHLQRFGQGQAAATVSTAHPEAERALRENGFETIRLLDRMALSITGNGVACS
jgi:ribosomal protein S18 acetylase RimI-like enzyme